MIFYFEIPIISLGYINDHWYRIELLLCRLCLKLGPFKETSKTIFDTYIFVFISATLIYICFCLLKNTSFPLNSNRNTGELCHLEIRRQRERESDLNEAAINFLIKLKRFLSVKYASWETSKFFLHLLCKVSKKWWKWFYNHDLNFVDFKWCPIKDEPFIVFLRGSHRDT